MTIHRAALLRKEKARNGGRRAAPMGCGASSQPGPAAAEAPPIEVRPTAAPPEAPVVAAHAAYDFVPDEDAGASGGGGGGGEGGGVLSLRRGEPLDVLSTRGDWTYVRVRGTELGYVPTTCVTLGAGDGPLPVLEPEPQPQPQLELEPEPEPQPEPEPEPQPEPEQSEPEPEPESEPDLEVDILQQAELALSSEPEPEPDPQPETDEQFMARMEAAELALQQQERRPSVKITVPEPEPEPEPEPLVARPVLQYAGAASIGGSFLAPLPSFGAGSASVGVGMGDSGGAASGGALAPLRRHSDGWRQPTASSPGSSFDSSLSPLSAASLGLGPAAHRSSSYRGPRRPPSAGRKLRPSSRASSRGSANGTLSEDEDGGGTHSRRGSVNSMPDSAHDMEMAARRLSISSLPSGDDAAWRRDRHQEEVQAVQDLVDRAT